MRVLSKTGVGLVLFLVGMFAVYLVLLGAKVSNAQEMMSTMTTMQSTVGPPAATTVVIEKTVIRETIPKKPLPDTGGSTALVIGGALLLLYGGLVAWRLKTRER
ncbi:MAG: hypothetical protein CYG60_18460 [Actinobacteria bacterium]|jgi:LPXTG-motif cell wall-anchored protein|nr:LPXTG cell wall anchor domain-containing protein [Actinomycetota bacterium]PLS84344.1 MAG: hypothetical protein CYG60_18460 [Actinomycetota bacterium]